MFLNQFKVLPIALPKFSFTVHRFKHELTDHQKKLMAKNLPKKRRIPNVKNAIVVASGKGGVGKSTTSVNLAIGLSLLSKNPSVGLLDLDVFGPSIPKMMNLSGRPNLDSDENFIPLQNYGIKCMSMGFLMDSNEAAVWRGPMVMSAVQRLLLRTSWGHLDYLIMDLPPGTGDTQLSISQLVEVDGAIVVSTPQDVALIDARRATEMFHKVDIPVVGFVQNMSVFVCPKCGHQEHIFGQNGTKRMAQELDVELLGDVPLDLSIRTASDDGIPIAIQYPDSKQAKSFHRIAEIFQSKTNGEQIKDSNS